jgi:hypothetical protein
MGLAASPQAVELEPPCAPPVPAPPFPPLLDAPVCPAAPDWLVDAPAPDGPEPLERLLEHEAPIRAQATAIVVNRCADFTRDPDIGETRAFTRASSQLRPSTAGAA